MMIRHRALVVLGLLAALFLVGIVSSSWFLKQSNRALNDVQKEIRVVLSVIDPINHSRTMRVFLAESIADREAGRLDDAQTALYKAQTALAKSQQTFQTYMDHPKQPGEQALADAFRSSYQAYLDQALVPLAKAVGNGDKDHYQQLVTTTVPTLDRQHEIALNDLLAFREQYAKSLNDQAQARFTYSLIALAVLATLFVATLAVIFFWLRGNLLRALDKATGHCTDMANGDLRTRIVPRSNDEIGAMLHTLETMRESLSGTIAKVLGASQSVAHGSREIAAGNLDLSSRTEEQAASLEETAASMTQLTQTTRLNAENAAQASALASSAADVATRSTETVRTMVSTVTEIGLSSGKIAEITGLIEGISFQTNILALNAAVEAARAGEQGRGFAVVASEVRSLAQRSASAAKEIKELIDNSVMLARSGTEQAQSVGGAMDQMTESIQRVRDIVGEIAAASSEQAQGIDQVNQAVGQMDRVTQGNAALVEQAAAAAQSLDQQAATLKESVALFRIAE